MHEPARRWRSHPWRWTGRGKSYTSDTLEAIHKQYPDAELWLLMGTDMFLTLHHWHDPGTITRLAGICAFGRTEQDGEAVFAPQREYLAKHFGAKVVTITLPGWWTSRPPSCGICSAGRREANICCPPCTDIS